MAENNDQSAEVVSQSEVEEILKAIASEASETQVIGAKKKTASGEEMDFHRPSIQIYDFRNPQFLTPAELRRLRIKHEEFIHNLASGFSIFLRADFALTMSRLETVPFRNLLDNAGVPTHVTLFRLNPLKGICLFDISPRLGLTCIDRLAGGGGHSVKVEREFTDVEKVILDNLIALALSEYSDSWLKYKRLDYEILEHENTVRFLNIVDPDDVMLLLEMEARFGDCVAPIRFVIPYHAIEEMVLQMMAEISREEPLPPTAPAMPSKDDANFYEIPVPMSVHWRGFSLKLRELRSLQVGDVLMLDPKKCDLAYVDMGVIQKFRAKVRSEGPTVVAEIVNKIR